MTLRIRVTNIYVLSLYILTVIETLTFVGNISDYYISAYFCSFFILIIQENKEQVLNDDREIYRNFSNIIFNPL